MGADESKAASGSMCHSYSSHSVNFPNSCRHYSDSVAWTLLHQTTSDQWKDTHAACCNFSEKTLSCDGGLHKDCSQSFCISRQGFVNLSKASAIFSFRKRSKFYKMAEHFEYNHIPAQMSSVHHFRVVSVVCFRDRLVVLHLSRSGMDQLGILDLGINKFQGVFAKLTAGNLQRESLYGALSPDKTRCLVRLPSVAGNPQTDELHLYDLKSQKLMQKRDLHFLRSTHVVFDPRFCWKRAAVTNFESFHAGNDNTISIVDLSTFKSLATNNQLSDTRGDRLYPYLRDLQYSPDGSLIVATLLDIDCLCREKRTRNYRPVSCSIYVLNSDTAVTLRCIQYSRFTCHVHMCPTNYIPVFSNCGSRMSVVMNERDQPGVHYVQVYKLPHVINLQNICRVIIRQHVATESLVDLPLPVKLINYLHFKPEY